MSKNAPKNIAREDFDKHIKSLRTTFTQFNNGYTITKKDYNDAVEALRELKRLPALIEYYVGFEDEDI